MSQQHATQQSQRLAMLGRLITGVSHEFNNLVTVLCGYGDMVVNAAGRNGQLRKDAEEIQKAAQRAATLTRQLLGFGRVQPIQRRPRDLNAIVADLTTMLRRLIREDIELETSLAPELPPVRVDAGQIEQVIMNLVLNARDAMPHGGRLFIETTPMDLAEGQANNAGKSPAGRCVVLSVSDTGCGMDAQDFPHIFEPFFSTKEPGRGTGLGLAIVQEIVEQNGGSVSVSSQPGHGTTFKITFPRAEETAPSIYLLAQRSISRPGTETILLAEGDEQVRSYVRDALCNAGYTVLEAPDGAEAVRLLDEHKAQIGLVLVDGALPRMSGVDIADRVARAAAAIRVLFMSGHPDKAVAGEKALATTGTVLRKPFSTQELLSCVRAVIDGADRPPKALTGIDSTIDAA